MGSGILLLIVGIVVAKLPGMVWFFAVGWLIKDAEPSDSAIKFYRYIGIFLLIIGVISIIDIL